MMRVLEDIVVLDECRRARLENRVRRPSQSAIGGAAALTMWLSVLVVGRVAPAQASPSGSQIEIVDSKCIHRDADGHPTLKWWGAGNQSPKKSLALDSRVRGRLYVCAWKFKAIDRNKNYDWWGASVQSVWVRDGGEAVYAAQARHQIASTRTSASGEYDATPSIKSDEECGRQWDVTVALGPVSVGTPVQSCKNFTFERTRGSDAAAAWKAPKIGGFQAVETLYTQKIKVKKGGTPTFYLGVTVPRYNTVWQNQPGYWKSVPDFTSVTITL